MAIKKKYFYQNAIILFEDTFLNIWNQNIMENVILWMQWTNRKNLF